MLNRIRYNGPIDEIIEKISYVTEDTQLSSEKSGFHTRASYLRMKTGVEIVVPSFELIQSPLE